MNTSDNRPILNIYFDYATIPTLNYFLDFVENVHRGNTINLFGLARFRVPDEVVQQFPERVFFTPITQDDHTPFTERVARILNSLNQAVHVRLHLNLMHSWYSLESLLTTLRNNQHRFASLHFHFHDDGAASLINTRNLICDEYLAQKIADEQTQIKQLWQTGSATLQHPELAAYLWNCQVPSTYHVLSDDYLNLPSANNLRAAMSDYQVMQFHRFSQWSDEQKNLFLRLINIDEQTQKNLDLCFQPHFTTFLFTGTTWFNRNTEIQRQLTQTQIQLLRQSLNPDSPCYVGKHDLLLIKPHPNEREAIAAFKQNFPQAIILPENLPLDILFLMGYIPNQVGGFSSTSYFTCPRKNIAYQAFMVESQQTEFYPEEHRQFVLKEIMRELNICPPDKLFCIDELI